MKLTNVELVAQLVDAVEANDGWLIKAGALVERLDKLEEHLENVICECYHSNDVVDFTIVRKADRYLNNVEERTND